MDELIGEEMRLKVNSPLALGRFLFLAMLIFLAGCVSSPPSVSPTQDALPTSETTPVILSDETATPVLPVETPTPSVPVRTQYTLYATLDYTAKLVAVEQNILYPNHNGKLLTTLVLAVVPNLWPNCFRLASLNVDGALITDYALNGQRLEFELPRPLLPESTIAISLQYSLSLPFAAQGDPNRERPRIFGYTERQVNLNNWYPFVVPYLPGQGWVLHDPWYYGEHLVYEAADYTVNFRSVNPDQGLVVASSGWGEPQGEWTRYTLIAGRAFAFSVSPQFEVVSKQVGEVSVYSYFFPVMQAHRKGGEDVLATTAQALELFAQRFGPYPHRTLSAVMGDFNDGMEYSAFFFLPRDFYNSSADSPKNYLTFVAAHETAHQWWFDAVANDQALEPWLDESLCNYSERLYYEAYYPDLVAWWWPYRMYYYDRRAKIDIPLYEGGGFYPYTNATYFRGAHFLEDLRTRMGNEAFFAFLRDYRRQYDGRIASSEDFFAVLRQHTDADISDLLQAYFKNPAR